MGPLDSKQYKGVRKGSSSPGRTKKPLTSFASHRFEMLSIAPTKISGTSAERERKNIGKFSRYALCHPQALSLSHLTG
jgi:hypothetical protein